MQKTSLLKEYNCFPRTNKNIQMSSFLLFITNFNTKIHKVDAKLEAVARVTFATWPEISQREFAGVHPHDGNSKKIQFQFLPESYKNKIRAA